MADKLLSEDMQQYLQNALGVYGQGLAGEQGFYNTGFQASQNLADMLAGNLGSQAGLAYQGQQQKNMNQQALVNALMKLLGTAGGAGLGFGMGGPLGGLYGAQTGSNLF